MFKDTEIFKEVYFNRYSEEQIDELKKLRKCSGKTIWWKCDKSNCVHVWRTKISNRANKRGCPFCSNRQICPCKDKCNSFGYIYKNSLIKEWDFENNKLSPYEVFLASKHSVSWICKKAKCIHKWKATINNRTSSKTNCPICSNRQLCEDKCNSFGFIYKDSLVNEWDYNENKILPFDIFPVSKHNVSWLCKKSPCGFHKWEATISNRTRTGTNKTGCPICANKKLCPCEDKCNSLVYLHPKLIKEWNFTKNKLSPYNYFPSSSKKVWWICSKDHEWFALINCRTGKNKSGCPICKESKGEKLIAGILNELKIKYKRQKTFKPCIDERLLPFDFYLPDQNICIEYDGRQHYELVGIFGGQDALELIQWHDMIKNIFCEEYKIPLLRIKYTAPNDQVKQMIIDFIVSIKL